MVGVRHGDTMDSELLRDSRIARIRLRNPAVTDGQIGDKQFHPWDSGCWDSKVYNDGDVVILSQVAIIGTRWASATPIGTEPLVQKILTASRESTLSLRESPWTRKPINLQGDYSLQSKTHRFGLEPKPSSIT